MGGNVTESDETNNCRAENWKCDATPPEITEGPAVSVNTTSAVVSWESDEDSYSMVKFGLYAGKYDNQRRNTTRSKEHEVTITGLTPSTVYHYIVQSEDASENVVVSGGGFFETDPTSDYEHPIIFSLTLSKVKGPFPLYKLTAPVSDNVGIKKVEFYMDSELIGVDYSGSGAKTREYNVYIDPAGRGISRQGFFASHGLWVVAQDKSGLTQEFTLNDFTPPAEPPNGELEILSPSPDYTMYFHDTVVPEGTSLDIKMHAAEYEYDCLITDDVFTPMLSSSDGLAQGSANGGGYETPEWMPVYEPPTCREVERAGDRVELYIDMDQDREASLVDTWTPSSNSDLSYAYPWDAGGFGAGTYYAVARAYLSDGTELWKTRDIEIAHEGVSVESEITRYDNVFQILYWFSHFRTNRPC